MEVHVGVRVVRGPDWEWGDQDGGEGHVGTVVEVGEPSVSDGGRAVVVQWDCAERCKYRCGLEDKYDLRGFDSAPSDLYKDEGFYVCVGCGLRELEPGFDWICCQCSCYFLCTSCYMAGKHNNQHIFCRTVYERQWGLVPKRKGAHLTEVKGIFPGATVMRGKDWSLGNEDGGQGGLGKVVAISSSKDGKKLQDIAEVEWFSMPSKKTKCRVGCKGKVDLLCVSAATAGLYYLEHLPVLSGQQPEKYCPTIRSGDLVEVELDVEIFRMMQEEHGGWNDEMANLLGQVGFVHHICDSGDLLVKYPSHNWLLNPSVVVKILRPLFVDGDIVRITNDRKKAIKAQNSIGSEWSDGIIDILGEEGIIDGSDSFGVMSVIVRRKRWFLNRLCLERTGKRQTDRDDIVDVKDDPALVSKLHSLLAERDPDVLAYAAQLGDEHVIREFLKNAPNEVNRIVDCKAPIHYAAKAGSIAVVKALLEFQADVNKLDDMLQSALHFALHCLKIRTSGELVECLLEAGADPNIQNIAGETPLMIASRNGCYTAVKVLAECSKTDFNITNLDGATALMTATISHNIQSIKLLLGGRADPSRPNTVNSEYLTLLHFAAKHGFSGAVEEFVEYFPELVNLKDDEGKTPLHIAISNNHFHLATYLMERANCDINSKDNSGQSPLHTAISEGKTYLIEQMIGYGVNFNIADESELTPLNVLAFLDVAGVTVKFQPISDSTPELLKVRKIISNEDVEVHTVIACLLIQEGAHLSGLGLMGLNSSQTLAIAEAINPTVMKTIKDFAEKYSGTGCYHGSLKKSSSSYPKSVAAEAEDSASSHQTVVDSCTKQLNLCELCEEEPIGVKFLPCSHSILCELCATRVTKCLKCKIPITAKEKL